MIKRFAVLVALIATTLIASGAAYSAADLQLRVLSETTTTITYGWDQVVGADGFDFYKAGVRVSQTRDGSRTSVKFGKIIGCDYECYGVEGWQKNVLAFAAAPVKPQCMDKKDNDGDGKIDLADPGCSNNKDNDETDPTPPAAACADGLDNDGDGKVDYPADPGCTSATDTSEVDPAPAPACSDTIDNDGDGKVDYPNDPGCSSATDTDETDPVSGGTITSSQCSSRASVNGALIENVTVSGGCDVTGDNVTFNNVTVNGSLDVRPTASGTKVLASKMLQASIMGGDNTLIEGSVINCNKQVKDGLIIWDEPAGDYPDGYTLRGNTFENCVDVQAGDHSQAIYNGYARNGLIENNYFYNNGSTAHIFFTWFGNKADPATTYPRDICVRGNTFVNPPGGEFHYYDINFRSEIPTSANIKIDPDQWPNRQTSNSDHRFDADC